MSKSNEGIQPAAFNNNEAANYLGVSASSLEKSRVTGHLLGIPGPTYSRIGKSVRYLRVTCDEWLKSLPQYKHSAEEHVSKQQTSGGAK